MFGDPLNQPTIYRILRGLLTGGLPYESWVKKYHLNLPDARISDIGCGPADILRFVDANCLPEFYLGLDINRNYLETAKQNALKKNISSCFLEIDLESLSSDKKSQINFIGVMEKYSINTVLLLGVIHHLTDESVKSLLSILGKSATVETIITQDITFLPNNFINNIFARLDRGEFVRTPDVYDELLNDCDWTVKNMTWSNPGLCAIKYIHFELTKT